MESGDTDQGALRQTQLGTCVIVYLSLLPFLMTICLCIHVHHLQRFHCWVISKFGHSMRSTLHSPFYTLLPKLSHQHYSPNTLLAPRTSLHSTLFYTLLSTLSSLHSLPALLNNLLATLSCLHSPFYTVPSTQPLLLVPLSSIDSPLHTLLNTLSSLQSPLAYMTYTQFSLKCCSPNG